MGWKPMVRTGSDPKFYTNALVFATKEEAEASARELMGRWMAVMECKADEYPDEKVTHEFKDGRNVERGK